MKKLILLTMVLMITWTVYLKDGKRFCAKEVNTGAYKMVRIVACDGHEILIPYDQILRIEEER